MSCLIYIIKYGDGYQVGTIHQNSPIDPAFIQDEWPQPKIQPKRPTLTHAIHGA